MENLAETHSGQLCRDSTTRASDLSSVKIGSQSKCDRRRWAASNVLAFKVPVVCVDMYAEALKTKVKTGMVHRANAWCFYRIFDRKNCIDQ
jgi:hypothetical protein